MKSALLSNINIKLYSTNDPTKYVKCTGNNYIAYSCQCLISDTCCECCRVILGYHILRPCTLCMTNKNNGHLWMFDISSVSSNIRSMNYLRIHSDDSFMFDNEYDHEVRIR